MGLRILAFLFIALFAARSSADVVRWRLSESYARAESSRSSKLMMVELYSTGRASVTSRMVVETYTDARVIAYARNFVTLRQAIGREGAELARKLGVQQAGI